MFSLARLNSPLWLELISIALFCARFLSRSIASSLSFSASWPTFLRYKGMVRSADAPLDKREQISRRQEMPYLLASGTLPYVSMADSMPCND